MNKQEQDKIVSDVKSVLPSVVKFMEAHDDIVDFDYGYLYGAGIWECQFFDENDESILYFTAESEEDLIDTLSLETIARWHNEDN